jgi:ABC-type nitrate/sulfonate/bicarbonate transport system substrate-binding protein
MSISHLSRRAFAARALAAPFVIRPGSVFADDLKEISYITPFGHSVVYAPDYVASTAGLFAKNGLKVNIIGGSGSSTAVQQTVAGQVQVARTGGIDVVRAVGQRNAPIRAIGTVCQSSTWHIISAQDGPIKAPADLAGKTIGIVSAGGGSEDTVNIVLAAANIPKDNVKRQVVGNSPGAFDLVKLKRIDGFICDNSVVANLQAISAPIVDLPLNPFVAIPGQVYLASQSMIDKNSDVLLSYLKAVKAAIGLILADPTGEETYKMMQPFDFPELRDQKKAIAALNAEKGVWTSRGAENVIRNFPDAWSKGWDQMVAAELVKPGDPTLAYTTQFNDKL